MPKQLPQLCSLLVGYFSYDIIRYIEKIPDNCLNDLQIPDIRILRPKNIIIHDNLHKKIYFIVNCFADEKINNYTEYFNKLIQNIKFLKTTISKFDLPRPLKAKIEKKNKF